jgi:hypothetical protein
MDERTTLRDEDIETVKKRAPAAGLADTDQDDADTDTDDSDADTDLDDPS